MKPSVRQQTPKKQGYIYVGTPEEIVSGKPVTVRLMGKPVSVFKGDEGFFAREMGCKHQGADLSQAPMTGTRITCPRHGWQYDVLTGECQNHDSPPLRPHDVVVEGDAVFVALFPGEGN